MTVVSADRIRNLNGLTAGPKRGFVLYWMQQAQRAADNHAVEFAVLEANRLGLPAVAVFVIDAGYPEANLRHFTFMLEGLRETGLGLSDRGIPLVILPGRPEDVVVRTAADAALVVTDRGYTSVQMEWRRQVGTRLSTSLIEVETDVIVPVDRAYPKEAYNAAVLRRTRAVAEEPPEVVELKKTTSAPAESIDLNDPAAAARGLGVDCGVAPVEGTKGGAAAAGAGLARFVEERLDRYAEDRNDPGRNATSELSPYLHFGQLSPLYIAKVIGRATGGGTGHQGAAAFIEELSVRRELAVNLCRYNPRYDSPGCLPAWAVGTLDRHADDRRPVVYSEAELEAGATHDPYWNAAQREMVLTGRMHGYMRMYWGKKILEWSPDWRSAYAFTLKLNNRYFLDGRDPNGFAGVAWCYGKHDRPWPERPVYGTVRSMSFEGLRRKFDMDAYLLRVGSL